MENKEDSGKFASKTPIRHTGGCHCGAVRFEVVLGPEIRGSRCNCSICRKHSPTGCLVKPEALRLVAGDESLSDYEWGPSVSTRYFCKHCGVYCFGKGNIPELGGHFASVNLNCLDELDVEELEIVYWDGRHDNWAAGPRSKPWPLFPERAAAKADPATPGEASVHAGAPAN